MPGSVCGLRGVWQVPIGHRSRFVIKERPPNRIFQAFGRNPPLAARVEGFLSVFPISDSVARCSRGRRTGGPAIRPAALPLSARAANAARARAKQWRHLLLSTSVEQRRAREGCAPACVVRLALCSRPSAAAWLGSGGGRVIHIPAPCRSASSPDW